MPVTTFPRTNHSTDAAAASKPLSRALSRCALVATMTYGLHLLDGPYNYRDQSAAEGFFTRLAEDFLTAKGFIPPDATIVDVTSEVTQAQLTCKWFRHKDVRLLLLHPVGHSDLDAGRATQEGRGCAREDEQ